MALTKVLGNKGHGCVQLFNVGFLFFVDIDECAMDMCDENAHCIITNGSYICTCKQGYFGDGKNCTIYEGEISKLKILILHCAIYRTITMYSLICPSLVSLPAFAM